MKEKCVICGETTDIDKDTHISLRENYIECCGQLCEKCGEKYNK